MTKILGVSGSQRAASRSRHVVDLVLDEARTFGAQTRLLNLFETNLPHYQPDTYESAPQYEPIRQQVVWADAIILGTPDYHGGMASPIKNFLDHHWEELAGKLFGFVVSSHEKGLTVQDQMRTTVRQCYGWSLPYGIGFNNSTELEAGGAPKEPLAKRIRMMARDLTVYGALLHGQFEADLAAPDTPPSFAARYKAGS